MGQIPNLMAQQPVSPSGDQYWHQFFKGIRKGTDVGEMNAFAPIVQRAKAQDSMIKESAGYGDNALTSGSNPNMASLNSRITKENQDKNKEAEGNAILKTEQAMVPEGSNYEAERQAQNDQFNMQQQQILFDAINGGSKYTQSGFGAILGDVLGGAAQVGAAFI